LEGILLIPIAEVDPQILEYLQLNLKNIFQVEVHIGESIPNPSFAYNGSRGQYNSTLILQRISKPEGYGKVLLIADFDLYTGGLNFVFGEADILGGIAIISLARLRQEFYGLPSNEDLFKERTLKEAVHELGHLYGLRHCKNSNCVMYFSNSLPDTDRKSFNFCPTHRKELEGLP
jgi:archaemetzincin